MDRVYRRHRSLVCRARLDRRPHLSGGAAGAGPRRHDRRTASHWPRRHLRWPECLAVDGRYGSRVGLGPRKLRGAGLDGRLAASRSHVHPRPLERFGRGVCGFAAGASGRTPEPAPTAHADEYLRRCSGTVTVDPVRAAAFDANLAHYTDVFTRGRDEYAIPPGTLTDTENLRKLAGLLLLDVVGRVDQPSERHDHLYEQLAS